MKETVKSLSYDIHYFNYWFEISEWWYLSVYSGFYYIINAINRLYTPNAVKIPKLKVKREFVSPKNLRDFKFQAAINSPKVMRLDTKKKFDKKASLSTLKNNFEISQSWEFDSTTVNKENTETLNPTPLLAIRKSLNENPITVS